MKYAIIIPDGAGDLPLDELDGKTPLEAAETPNLDRLASIGRVGAAATTPPGFGAGSDVCSMSLLGYDPAKHHTGRAPLEAAALGLNPGERDWIFRVNLVHVSDDGRMIDHSAGAITDAEARELVEALTDHWRAHGGPAFEGMTLTPGVSYRNILVDAGGREYGEAATTPPHEIPGEAYRAHLPTGGASGEVLRGLIESSAVVLASHPVNAARTERGLRTANLAWIWGQGTRPAMPSFQSRFGLRGAMTTAVDLLAGISAYIGWDRLHVPGATSYHDNDYAGQGKAAAEALDRYDLVCCHVEAPDEASHQGDWKTKVAAIEAIDRHVVGPIATKLAAFGDAEAGDEGWRLLVLPDHYTLVSTKKHDATPVPFLMAGGWVRSVVQRPFTERAAAESDLFIEHGHELMEYFLRGGVR